MEQLFEDTFEKVEYLKEQGFEVKQKWECELVEEMEHDEDMRRYFEEYELVDPLQPRDAFYGGRTNAINQRRQSLVILKLSPRILMIFLPILV